MTAAKKIGDLTVDELLVWIQCHKATLRGWGSNPSNSETLRETVLSNIDSWDSLEQGILDVAMKIKSNEQTSTEI